MDDTISRKAAIELIENESRKWGDEYGVSDVLCDLSDMPSAQRKGKWIYPTDIRGYGRCPHCKALWDYSLISNPFFKFCPRCGNGENEFAELKGEEDESK